MLATGGVAASGSAAARPMGAHKPRHEHVVPQVEPEPKDAKLVGPMNGMRLPALMKEVDPEFTLHADTEELLLALAQDHIEGVASAAVELARHRNSDTVELQDLQLCLEKDWDMPWLGIGNPSRSNSLREARTGRLKLEATIQAERAAVTAAATPSWRKKSSAKRKSEAASAGSSGKKKTPLPTPSQAQAAGAAGGAGSGSNSNNPVPLDG